MTATIVLPLDTLAYIIEKAREFDAEMENDDPNSGSNPADDGMVAILECTTDNPVEEELRSALGDLNEDQLSELLALVWIGRGDYGADGWTEALRDARRAKNKRLVNYLVGTPMLGDLLAEGLAEIGYAAPLPREEALG